VDGEKLTYWYEKKHGLITLHMFHVVSADGLFRAELQLPTSGGSGSSIFPSPFMTDDYCFYAGCGQDIYNETPTSEFF
jgi:hypothetical protein